MANSKIHVFDAASGHFRQSLIGHDLGVWALVLVSPRRTDRSRTYDTPQRSSSDTGASRRASFTGATPPTRSTPAFLQLVPLRTTTCVTRARPSACARATSADRLRAGAPRRLVVSGGCDRDVRVWNIATGECIHKLRGHSSTIRCLKVLDGRPIAVSGSRDFTLRVWDIDRGRMLRVLEGHEQSVRCMRLLATRSSVAATTTRRVSLLVLLSKNNLLTSLAMGHRHRRVPPGLRGPLPPDLRRGV
jgi:F-box and WD-40 domain protein CDC4